MIVRALKFRLGPHSQMTRRLTCHGNRQSQSITVFVPEMRELLTVREIMDDAWEPVAGMARVWHQTPREALATAVRASFGPAYADATVSIQFIAANRPKQTYIPTGFRRGRPRSLPRKE